MQRPAKSSNTFPAVGFLVLLILGFAGQSFANKKPKFVYVANTGASASGDRIATFHVTATAICGGSQCASPISISGSFTIDLTTGKAISGTMSLIDSSDLKSSPLALPFALQGNFLPTPNEYLFFRSPGGTNPISYVEMFLPSIAPPGL
jgi:hypothetical protein